MALTQIKWIRAIGLRDQKRREKKGRGKERRRGTGREEEEKRRRKEDSKVWNLTLSMDYLNFLYGYMFLGCGLWVVRNLTLE